MLIPSSGLTISSTSCVCYPSPSPLAPQAPTRLWLFQSTFSCPVCCCSLVLHSRILHLMGSLDPCISLALTRFAQIRPSSGALGWHGPQEDCEAHLRVSKGSLSSGTRYDFLLLSIFEWLDIYLWARLTSIFSGPVAFVLTTLFEDFKKKREAWLKSV
jgi:hypothetical protein